MLYRTILHADWSVDHRKRWVSVATRTATVWEVRSPEPVGELTAFVDRLFATDGPVLAGFDFPIGLPASYASRAELSSFRGALGQFGKGNWSSFYVVAEHKEEVSVRRPFYPRVSIRGSRRAHLTEGLGVGGYSDLLRVCDRRTKARDEASALFWTLGSKQVGKAALDGWRNVLAPALARGALLWPFDGDLDALSHCGKPVLAETYPAEAYAHAGISLGRGASKRRQDDRRRAMSGLARSAACRNVAFSPHLRGEIDDGFGISADGEDRFDALAGALGMIEVVEGRAPETPVSMEDVDPREGWILGQATYG